MLDRLQSTEQAAAYDAGAGAERKDVPPAPTPDAMEERVRSSAGASTSGPGADVAHSSRRKASGVDGAAATASAGPQEPSSGLSAIAEPSSADREAKHEPMQIDADGVAREAARLHQALPGARWVFAVRLAAGRKRIDAEVVAVPR